MQWKRNGEHASCSGNISDGQRAEVRLDAVPSDGQAQAQPRPVGTALGEWREHRFSRSMRQSAAMVMHFDERLAVKWESVKGYFRVRVRELESVLEEVGQGGVQQGSIASDCHTLSYGAYHQTATRCIRFKACGAFGVLDERCD